jgi:hypothetical protein
MQLDGVPPWCRWRLGAGPLLLVAPHGGQCRPPPSPVAMRRRRVNDLHTAEITAALAARLDASFVANTALDRNELDLNRITHVSRRAPWFLRLLESVLGSLLQRHPTVEVWFIHGWNVIQPKCDIGIGAPLTTLAEVEPRRDTLTVSPDYVRGRLELFRTHCARAGVHASYGDRYAASHPNNLLQLFRQSRGTDGPSARLASWAAAGRLQAVQLELAVPLRWEGTIRDRFLGAVQQAFSSPVVAAAGFVPPPTTGVLCPPPTAIAFYDPRTGFGLIAGVATTPDQRFGGRLLVFDRAGAIALFTGEDAPARGTVLGGPQFVQRPSGFALQFSGSLLEVDDGALYLHLEHAFSRSRLIDAHVDLTYRPFGSGTHGGVSGAVRLGRRQARIDGLAFSQVALLQRTTDAAPLRATFAAVFDPGTAIHARHLTPVSTSRVDVSGPPLQPTRFSVELDDGRTLTTRPVNRILIQRPLATGGHEIINLGVALFSLNGDRDGAGVFEYARRLDSEHGHEGYAREGSSAVKLA